VTGPPDTPKIYHITHVENLARIVADGELVSDSEIVRRGGPAQAIGMSGIKKRRIEELDVPCHTGTRVGDYVPFYFCPRSFMLFVIHCANHPELTYRGGQGPIIHLEADLHKVIRWADANGRRWAFSLSNAGARYTEFRASADDLDELDWRAIGARDFRNAQVKEGKQAEFLVHERFPFNLVDRIGVLSAGVQARARGANRGAYQPPIEVRPEWYF
jgi:ssDNA thymidine ADP-ribosyltransferase, DarT